MAEDPNTYHCHLPADMSAYDHLPYHINPQIGDGSHIRLYSGNIIRGCTINYLDKKYVVPNREDEE